MAFEKIGYKIGDYQIELVWVDCQSDPAKAAEAYEEAIVQKGIQAGLLNWHSSVAVALMQIAANHKIPHFFGLGAASTVDETFHSDPDKYFYWIKGWPQPAKLTASYLQCFEDAIAKGTWKPKAKTIAIWGEETDWGRSFGRGLREQFTKAGWEVVLEEYFPLEQTDYIPFLTKVKELNPAVLGGTGSSPPQYASLVKQADEVGLESLFIADGVGWVGEWYDLIGDSSNYVIDQIPGFATAEAKAFAKEFEEKTGLKPSPSAAGLCYDYANFFIKMVQQVYKDTGTLSSETIAEFSRNKLQTGEFTYTDGIVMEEYKFTPETVPDMVVGKGYFIFPVLQYSNGEGKIIFPPEWAEKELEAKP
jgi:branched-chain amino acid transport system substrate-binding protein